MAEWQDRYIVRKSEKRLNVFFSHQNMYLQLVSVTVVFALILTINHLYIHQNWIIYGTAFMIFVGILGSIKNIIQNHVLLIDLTTKKIYLEKKFVAYVDDISEIEVIASSSLNENGSTEVYLLNKNQKRINILTDRSDGLEERIHSIALEISSFMNIPLTRHSIPFL